MLQKSIDWLLYSVLALREESGLIKSLNFFLYDSIKILLLLFFMISLIGFLRSYLSPNKVRSWLSDKGVFGYLFASLFGSVTPFCSCSSIPIFLGFLEAGIPLGITFSFLITSPLINEYLVVLMLGFFGWKITVFYVVSGIMIGVVSGLILGRMRLERYIIKAPRAGEKGAGSCGCAAYKGIRDRVGYGIGEARSIVRRLWPWVLLGVALGSLIHNYVPQEMVHSIIARAGYSSVPIAALLGVPMYGNCAAIVPIAVVLFRKGVPLGTALAFMMAIVALSAPEAAILKSAMRLKLVAIFFAITTAAIIVTGYLFNFLQGFLF
jgi:uncharacterized membrane protein YraQ (UPF0718 family)